MSSGFGSSDQTTRRITELERKEREAAKPYTVATVPDASKMKGRWIFVSNGAAGSAVMAFSNGVNWLRCDTLAVISA